MILVVDQKYVDELLIELRKCDGCSKSEMIGSIVETETRPMVFMNTSIGGKRMISPLEGAMLP